MPSAELPSPKRGRLETTVLAFAASFCVAVFAFGLKGFAHAEPGGFPVFYTAGKLARFNLHQLYDQHLQNIFHPGSVGTGGYFYHPAYEVALLAPLSCLPQVAAFAVWSLLSVLCLLGVAAVMRRHFPSFSLFVPLAFAPTLSLLVNGQDTASLALLTALAFHQFMQGRDARAGVLLALGLFKFPFVLPLVLILGLRRRRLLAGFALGALPVTLISIALTGKQGVLDYIALARSTDGMENPLIESNLRGICGVLTGSFHPAWMAALSVALVLFAALLKAGRAPLFAVGVLVTMLVSWHGHVYDAVLLLIPLAWMMRGQTRWLRWFAAALLLVTPVFLFKPLWGWALAVPVCVLLLFLWVPAASRRMLAAP
jgi:Glycosyltransferase family 87